MVRHVKESERDLNQRINCYVSNAGTDCDCLRNQGRRVDSQYYRRGSESVVVGGVTTTQGALERSVQGKGMTTIEVVNEKVLMNKQVSFSDR